VYVSCIAGSGHHGNHKIRPPKTRKYSLSTMENPYLPDMDIQPDGILRHMPATAPAPVVAWCGGSCGEARAAFLLISYGHFPISIRIPPLGPNHGKKESLASATQRHPGDHAIVPLSRSLGKHACSSLLYCNNCNLPIATFEPKFCPCRSTANIEPGASGLQRHCCY
jgi:hypothetical protein